MNHQTFCNECKREKILSECHGITDCIIPSFFSKNNQPAECFLIHIDGLLKSWDMLSKKYIPSLLRITCKLDEKLNENDINKYLKLLCIFHDVGKLTNFYKNGISRDDFRHEFISAYVFYEFAKDIINNRIVDILTATILLHHEPILMGQIHTTYETKLTATELYRRIMNLPQNIKMLDDWKLAINYFLKKHYNELNIDNKFSENFIIPIELYKFLQKFISRIRNTGMKTDKIHKRIFVGAFLSILVLCDYKSAENRGENSKVSFFWYTAKKEFE